MTADRADEEHAERDRQDQQPGCPDPQREAQREVPPAGLVVLHQAVQRREDVDADTQHGGDHAVIATVGGWPCRAAAPPAVREVRRVEGERDRPRQPGQRAARSQRLPASPASRDSR